MRYRRSPWLIIFIAAISGWAETSARSPDVSEQRSLASNIQFIEDLVIKSVSPNNRYSFSAAGVETDSQGHIYVLNLDEPYVLKFNARGEFLGAWGKKGQGPGELEAPSSMCIDNQDNLYVHDVLKLSLAVFDKNGKFIRNIRGTEYLAWTSKIVIDPDGNIVCGYQPISSNRERHSYLIGKFDPSFSLIRNIYKKEAVITTYRFSTEGGVFSLPAPRHTPAVVWTSDHEGRIYVGYSDTYDIQILSGEGELIKEIHRDVKPVKISEEEKKEVREDYEKKYRASAHLIKFAQVKPVFTRLYVVEGYLFVLRERVGRDYFYDVFTKAGGYLGDIKLDFQPLVCRDGFVYTIRFEFEGAPSPDTIIDTEIVRYKIAR